jgi:hypothetical protein
VGIVPLERKFLDFQNTKKLVLDFFNENPGQKCDYLELAKSRKDVFCISQSYLIISCAKVQWYTLTSEHKDSQSLQSNSEARVPNKFVRDAAGPGRDRNHEGDQENLL